MTTLEKTVSILTDLVEYPSVSSESNLEIINYLSDKIKSLGGKVDIMTTEDKKQANIFCTIGPEIDGGIVLSGHTDVVPAKELNWNSDPFKLTKKDNLLYGRGTCDMKGFIASTIAATEILKNQKLKYPVHFSFTYDEEIGCFGARHLAKELKKYEYKPSMVIIGEPTNMEIIEAHKGDCEYTTCFHGMEGHASNPEKGLSAIQYGSLFTNKLFELANELKKRAPSDSPFNPPWTTIQPGKIEGGVAHNVIAGQCSIDWEMRPINEEDKNFVKNHLSTYCDNNLLSEMQSKFSKAKIETEIIGEIPGLIPKKNNQARVIMQELLQSNSTGVISFGTEAGIFQEMDMDVVVCGPGSIDQAHKANEFISLSELEKCLMNLLNLLNQWSKRS
jgi:acetylornithine deacetylase